MNAAVLSDTSQRKKNEPVPFQFFYYIMRVSYDVTSKNTVQCFGFRKVLNVIRTGNILTTKKNRTMLQANYLSMISFHALVH